MPRSSPCRLATGCCTSRKRFSMSAALMCLTHTASYDFTRASLSALSDVTAWLPPRPRPLRHASTASSIVASRFAPLGVTTLRPTVQVRCSDFAPIFTTCLPHLAMSCSLHASTSRSLPRSSSARKLTPPKRPARSFALEMVPAARSRTRAALLRSRSRRLRARWPRTCPASPARSSERRRARAWRGVPSVLRAADRDTGIRLKDRDEPRPRDRQRDPSHLCGRAGTTMRTHGSPSCSPGVSTISIG